MLGVLDSAIIMHGSFGLLIPTAGQHCLISTYCDFLSHSSPDGHLGVSIMNDIITNIPGHPSSGAC